MDLAAFTVPSKVFRLGNRRFLHLENVLFLKTLLLCPVGHPPADAMLVFLEEIFKISTWLQVFQPNFKNRHVLACSRQEPVNTLWAQTALNVSDFHTFVGSKRSKNLFKIH